MVRKKKEEELQVPTFSDEKIIADKVNDTVGSGRFILIQTILLIVYILFQCLVPAQWAFDKYPFTLLNLILSFQAGYTGPFIVWAQNRASQRDRMVMAYIRDMVGQIKHVLDSMLRVEKKVDKEIKVLTEKVETLESMIAEIHKVTVKVEGQ